MYDTQSLLFEGLAGQDRVLRPNLVVASASLTIMKALLTRAGIPHDHDQIAAPTIVSPTTGQLYLSLAKNHDDV